MLASDWYAEMVGEPLEPLEPSARGGLSRSPARRRARLPVLRGLLAFHRARRARGLALIAAEPGATTVLLCEAWLRRRRAVVLLELIERRPRRRWRRIAYRAWNAAVLRPALRRALAGAQVLTEEEKRARADELGPGTAPVRADRMGALERRGDRAVARPARGRARVGTRRGVTGRRCSPPPAEPAGR